MKCANCRLCALNTNVEAYIETEVSEHLNEIQKNALGVISLASQKQLTGALPGAYCFGDHPHFMCKSYKNTMGQIVITFYTRKLKNNECFVCAEWRRLSDLGVPDYKDQREADIKMMDKLWGPQRDL